MSYRAQLCLVSEEGAVFGPLGGKTLRYTGEMWEGLGSDIEQRGLAALCLGHPRARTHTD